MKRTLSIVCHPNEFTGHGIHACQVIRRLPTLLGLDLVVRPTARGHFPADIAKLIRPGENDAEWEIILGPPNIQPTAKKRTIYMTTCESTRLSASSMQMINAAEIVVTPSQWCATVFNACGVNRPIVVVPLGVDNQFTYQAMPTGEPFTFACAGQLTNGRTRKGLQRIIELFKKAFPTENVRLNVKCLPSEMLDAGDSRISILAGVLPAVGNGFSDLVISVPDWLSECHCFINLATEGFGLWPLQAMAIGRPVISPMYGGVTEYLRPELAVKHRLVSAKDSWHGLGLWAEADEEAVIAAMRHAANPENIEAVSWMGHKAFWGTRHLTWENSIRKLSEILSPLVVEHPPVIQQQPIKRSSDPMADVTVCITAFNRPAFLERARASAIEAGFKVVVAEMSPDGDLGCNELWLRAAYMAKTERVIILHDDDVLLPELGETYRNTISPALDDGYAVTWRSAHLWDDGKVTPTEYFDTTPGNNDFGNVRQLQDLLCRSQLSLSPIVTVFHRQTLIHAVKEAGDVITHYHHPGMALGTEVLAHLRQSQKCHSWLYVSKVLSNYGVHDGSGTVQAERAEKLEPLIAGYDAVRDYWKRTPTPPKPSPRIIFVYSDYEPRDATERLRFEQAAATWKFHFDQGIFIEFKMTDSMFTRTSRDIGDSARVPYVKDLFDYAAQFALPEDIIVLANRDVCLTSMAAERIIAGIARSAGMISCPRRDMPNIQTGRMYRSVTNCKLDGGYDVFAVTPAWWNANRDKMADMFLGREAWDTVMRRIGEEQSEHSYVDNVCYHTAHFSEWQKDRKGTPSQMHNRRIALDFFTKRKDAYLIKLLT